MQTCIVFVLKSLEGNTLNYHQCGHPGQREEALRSQKSLLSLYCLILYSGLSKRKIEIFPAGNRSCLLYAKTRVWLSLSPGSSKLTLSPISLLNFTYQGREAFVVGSGIGEKSLL